MQKLLFKFKPVFRPAIALMGRAGLLEKLAASLALVIIVVTLGILRDIPDSLLVTAVQELRNAKAALDEVRSLGAAPRPANANEVAAELSVLRQKSLEAEQHLSNAVDLVARSRHSALFNFAGNTQLAFTSLKNAIAGYRAEYSIGAQIGRVAGGAPPDNSVGTSDGPGPDPGKKADNGGKPPEKPYSGPTEVATQEISEFIDVISDNETTVSIFYPIVQGTSLALLAWLLAGWYMAWVIAMNLKRPRIMIKFPDTAPLPSTGRIFPMHLESLGIPWKALQKRFKGLRIERVFDSLPPERMAELIAQARRIDPDFPNLLNNVRILMRPNGDPGELLGFLRLAVTPPIWERIYVDYETAAPSAVPAPALQPNNDPKYRHQRYLFPAPEGIDAQYAATQVGGRGERAGFIDIEANWNLKASDLRVDNRPRIEKILYGDAVIGLPSHGTNVLGIVMAADNTIECVGIADQVGEANVVSWTRADGSQNRPAAIAFAADHLLKQGKGGVLLLEVFVDAESHDHLQRMPIEILPDDFEAIRLATLHGVVVIEAAANGGFDLDQFDEPDKKILNRNDARFKDSGAILVAGATSNATVVNWTEIVPAMPDAHGPSATTNYGSRIDCYAWGEKVVTLDTAVFDGTSAASAIIAGAALAVQGVRKERGLPPLTSIEMRTTLINGGTPSINGAADRIGVMPNLRAVIGALPAAMAAQPQAAAAAAVAAPPAGNTR